MNLPLNDTYVISYYANINTPVCTVGLSFRHIVHSSVSNQQQDSSESWEDNAS